MRLVPNAPSFDKVGTLLAAECRLLLDAPACRGIFKVLGSGGRRVVLLREPHVSGRKVDRRVLAINVDAELWLITCVWDRTVGDHMNSFQEVPQDRQSYLGLCRGGILILFQDILLMGNRNSLGTLVILT